MRQPINGKAILHVFVTIPVLFQLFLGFLVIVYHLGAVFFKTIIGVPALGMTLVIAGISAGCSAD
jgi:hypothetical protein